METPTPGIRSQRRAAWRGARPVWPPVTFAVPVPWGHRCPFPPACHPAPGAGLVPVVLCLQRQLRKRTKCFSGSRIINFNLYIKSLKYWICWQLGRGGRGPGFSRVGELGISYALCRDLPAWNMGMESKKAMKGTGWHVCPSAAHLGTHLPALLDICPPQNAELWGSGVCLPQPPGSSSSSPTAPLTPRCPWG